MCRTACSAVPNTWIIDVQPCPIRQIRLAGTHECIGNIGAEIGVHEGIVRHRDSGPGNLRAGSAAKGDGRIAFFGCFGGSADGSGDEGCAAGVCWIREELVKEIYQRYGEGGEKVIACLRLKERKQTKGKETNRRR